MPFMFKNRVGGHDWKGETRTSWGAGVLVSAIDALHRGPYPLVPPLCETPRMALLGDGISR